MHSKPIAYDGHRPVARLSRPDRYRLAAEADAHIVVVESEWKRWLEDLPADGVVRERIRRVAVAMGFTVEPEPAEPVRRRAPYSRVVEGAGTGSGARE